MSIISSIADLEAIYGPSKLLIRSTRPNVEQVFFQCARAIVRSHFWDSNYHVSPSSLPSPGKILASMSDGEFGGEQYDKDWPTRAEKSLW